MPIAGMNGLIYNSELEKSLYEDYQPGFRSQLKNSGHYWYKNFKSKTAEVRVDGKYAVFALEYGINGGAGAIGDDDVYKTPRTADVEQQIVRVKNLQVQGEIGVKTIYATKNGGAFESLLEKEMNRAYFSAKDDQARGVITGEDEIIVKAKAVTAAKDISGGETIVMEVPSANRVQPGLIVDLYAANGTRKANNLLVTATKRGGGTTSSPINAKITLKATTKTSDTVSALAIAVGDFITVNGAKGKGINGLEDALLQTTNKYHGIDRATNEWYVAQQVDHADTELDEMAMRIVTDDVEIESDGYVDTYVAKHEVIRGYENQLSTLKQYTNSSGDGQDGAMNLAGGYKHLTFDGKPFWKDRMITDGTVYGINTATWFEEMHTDWRYDDLDGNIFKFTDGQRYYFRMLKYTNLSTDMPRGNFVIKNVKEVLTIS